LKSVIFSRSQPGERFALSSIADMDDARLAQLAHQFADRASVEHAADASGRLILEHFLEFGRAVRSGTRDVHQSVLTQIETLAAEQYEQLAPREKGASIGRALQAIVQLAARRSARHD
jgi:hypothetical protein